MRASVQAGLGLMTMAESLKAVARACGLARSLTATGERLPRVLLCPPGLPVPDGYFDAVIPTPPDPFQGRWFYLNKLVHPFALTPFRRTLFIDSDVVVRRPLAALVATHFAGSPVALFVKREQLSNAEVRGNHFTPKLFAERFGTTMVQNPDGGGNMYFESGPRAKAIVARALDFVTRHEDVYHDLTGNFGFVADELALLAMLTVDGTVLPSRPGTVHPVQSWEVDSIVADLLAGDGRDGSTLFHFFGQAKESEAYERLLRSIPARWPA